MIELPYKVPVEMSRSGTFVAIIPDELTLSGKRYKYKAFKDDIPIWYRSTPGNLFSSTGRMLTLNMRYVITRYGATHFMIMEESK